MKSKKMNTVDAMNYANKQFTVGRGPKESGKKKITLQGYCVISVRLFTLERGQEV